MKAINNFFSNDWANALGWTLLHSVWQSFIILLIAVVCLHFIPPILSRVRYAVTCAGFLLTIIISLFTFTYLINQNSSVITIPDSMRSGMETLHKDGSTAAVEISLKITTIIESNMPLIITVWMIGFVLFAMRLFSGVLYTNKLRASALPLHNDWSDYIKRLSDKLGITRFITLAESAEISSPMVIGYVKPIILVPVGMLTGLTTEQLETVFLHELAHIRRHDFLINFIQSVIEAVFFFNPFIWTLSNLIRREREYCCDDEVVNRHGSAVAYAHALAQLEEIRLSKSMFALSLAENKNQLLNRIKRIMEKSVKNYSGGDRMMIPAILLIAGLLCASWLSIHQENGYQGDSLLTDQDTSIRKNEKAARYSRKRIITIDKNGQPHEEIVEEFKGDEELRPIIEMDVLVPDDSFFIPPLPLQPPGPLMPPMDFDALFDSVPGSGFNFRDEHQWEEFSKAFEEKFRGKFEDFYSSHETDFSKIMKELQEKFESQNWTQGVIPFEHFKLSEEAFQQAQRAREEAFRRQEEALKKLNELEYKNDSFKNLQENMEKLQKNLNHLRNMELNMKFHDEKFQKYEKALREQLIKDGYITGDEKIRSMEWSDDVYKVNGRSIKDSDKKKYQQLHDKYFGDGRYFQKVE